MLLSRISVPNVRKTVGREGTERGVYDIHDDVSYLRKSRTLPVDGCVGV